MPAFREWFVTWVQQHVHALLYSVGQMLRAPGSTLVTTAVIGVSISLPVALYVFVENVQKLGASWDKSTQISLFLKPEVSDESAAALGRRLRDWPEVLATQVITRRQALEEYQQLSNFSGLAEFLDGNPLPAVIMIQPEHSLISAEDLKRLTGRFKAMPEVAIAQLDVQWVKRFIAIINMINRLVLILACILAIAVILIVGNTVRVAIDKHGAEIEIQRLFGATNRFIRRPFLYSGILYGLLGAGLAWLLIFFALRLLEPPVAELSALYATEFTIAQMSLRDTAVLLLDSAVLGFIGAWVTVSGYLSKFEVS